MKAEINNTNKERFFALYWGQSVLRNKNTPDVVGKVVAINSSVVLEFEYLLLKPMTEITEEHAVAVISEREFQSICSDPGYPNKNATARQIFLDSMNGAGDSFYIGRNELDFLRLNGYAVNWLGLSVPDLIEAGWVKLPEGSKYKN